MEGTPREMIKNIFGICFRDMNARIRKRFNEFHDFGEISASADFKPLLAMPAQSASGAALR
jgi:hypothetical protein